MNDTIERPKFLTEILAEIDGFDQSLFPCPYKMEEGDKVIGELPPWLQKLYALMRYQSREFKQLKVDLEFSSQTEGHENCKICEIKQKMDFLAEMFWTCARFHFNEPHAESVGVRQGWKFVISKPDPRERFKNFMGGFFGELDT